MKLCVLAKWSGQGMELVDNGGSSWAKISSTIVMEEP